MSLKIDYKFSEGDLVKELGEYIDSTYGKDLGSHYNQNKFLDIPIVSLRTSGSGPGLYC